MRFLLDDDDAIVTRRRATDRRVNGAALRGEIASCRDRRLEGSVAERDSLRGRPALILWGAAPPARLPGREIPAAGAKRDIIIRAIHSSQAPSLAGQGHQGSRVRPTDSHSGGSHSPGPAGARCHRDRADRQRQDGGLPASHRAPSRRQVTTDDARAGAGADARARSTDPGGSQRPHRAHAGDRRGRVRRRRDGAAGACVPQRRRRHPRDPWPALDHLRNRT